MHRGWTKRWRKRWDKGYHRNLLLWVMMDYFIDYAAYEPKDIYFKGHGLIHLERGEWAFTQRELANFFNVGRQQIRAQLAILESADFLTQDTTQSRTQHITKISIINYDTYQSDDVNCNPTNNPASNPTPTQLQPNPTFVPYITKNKRIKETTSCAFNDFDAFWEAYPKKIGKQSALKSWKIQSKNLPPIETIISKIEVLKKTEQWLKPGGQFIPYPATWLNRGGWDDQVEVEIGSSESVKYLPPAGE